MPPNPFTQRYFPAISARAELTIKILIAVVTLVVVGNSIERALYGTTDIDGFYEAGEYLLRADRLSTRSDIERYPPPFQAMMAVQALLPYGVIATLWALLSTAATFDLPRRFAELGGIPARRQWPAFLAASAFIIDILFLTQNSLVLLWLATAGLVAIRRGAGIRGGFAMGVAAFIKIFPAALFFVPLARMRIVRPLIGGALAAVFCFGMLLFFVPPSNAWEGTLNWLGTLRSGHTPAEMIENERSLRYNNQGVAITLARTFGDVGDAEIRGATRLAELPLSWIWGVHNALLVVMLLALVACAWKVRHEESGRAWLGLFAMTSLFMLAVSPLVWTHYFIWLLPGLVYFSDHKKFLIGTFVALTLLLLSDTARGLGVHMFYGIGLFAAIAASLVRNPGTAETSGGSATAASPPDGEPAPAAPASV